MQERISLEELRVAANQKVDEREFWLNKFSGEFAKVGFPYDSGENIDKEQERAFVRYTCPPELFLQLLRISKGADHTLHVVLTAALNALLYRYTGQKDITVGMPIYKQEVGTDFINTMVPLRNQLEENTTFKDLLVQVKQTIVEGVRNQNYPIEVLAEQLGLNSPHGNSHLMDIVILLQDIHDLKYIENLQTQMVFSFLRSPDSIEGEVEYNSRLYEEVTIKRIIDHFLFLQVQALSHPDARLTQLEIVPEPEKQQLLFEFNDTKREYQRDKMLHQLLGEQVEKTPDAAALIDEEQNLTYRELNGRSNGLARYLRMKGISREYIVGIMAHISIETVLGIIAVLKAGGAFLPIDPESPPDRTAYIARDGSVPFLLTSQPLKENILIERGLEIIQLNNRALFKCDGNNIEIVNRACHLAYVIFTSGSTGRPKGVQIQHNSIVNQIVGLKDIFFTGVLFNHMLMATFTFDPSVQQIFSPLTHGGKVFLVSNDIKIDAGKLLDFIILNHIDVFNVVPSQMEALLAYISQCKDKGEREKINFDYIILAGERFSKELYLKIKENFNCEKIINIYGPTEAAINTTFYLCGPGERHGDIPIGRPFFNYKVIIADKEFNLCPVGVPGEINISGDGLARGYLNQLELTKERFVENPFYRGERMYRTGDIARWLPDGNLQFLGRIDHQIKIRGRRIEPGEIENHLSQVKGIKEVVVVASESGPGKSSLCAYIVSSETMEPARLKDQLASTLPQYMIPSHFIFVDKIPLTSSGKVDRSALPEPELESAGKSGPRSALEEKLRNIWTEILDISKDLVGIDSSFFELGGNSLTATLLGARIRKELKVKLPLREVFNATTIRKMSELIMGLTRQEFAPLESTEEREYHQLSSAQKRMYILKYLDNQGIGYNIPLTVILEGNLDKTTLECTFRDLIQRHESLRTSFHMIAGEPVQKTHRYHEVDFNIQYDIAGHCEPGTVGCAAAIKNFIHPFDLSAAPLFRVGLIKLPHAANALRGFPRRDTYNSQKGKEDKYLLLVDMHHIITDGRSMEILVGDFVALYTGKELPAIRLQYKDYAVWQKKSEYREALKQQEKYWLTLFEIIPPPLELPVDFPRPPVQSFAGAVLSFEVPGELTRSINRMALDSETTLYMVLLAVYSILLSKISGQVDFVVGTPIAARRHADLGRIIGMFVNTLAIRTYPDSEKTVLEFLEEVKENSLQAFENQEYQFEDLVEKLSVNRDTSRNPLFDTMFTLQKMETQANEMTMVDMPQLRIRPYEIEFNTAKFDLNFTCFEIGEKLLCSLEYGTKLFKKDTIERFAIYFQKILSAVLVNGNQKISQIEIITAEEKRRILYDFNDTAAPYPGEKTLHRLFEEQVKRTPGYTALVGMSLGAATRFIASAPGKHHVHLTYNELNQKANQLANLLIEKGVEADTIVGIMVERSLEMIIGIFGILKSGSVYLPIDPDYPEERIHYLLADSGVKILLTERDLLKKIESEKEIIYISDTINYVSASHHPHQRPWINAPAVSLAYVIYTSGSTGNPKGVLIEHTSVVNMLLYLYKEYPFFEADVYLFKTSFLFDVSVTEIFGWYLGGGRLALLEPGGGKDPERILQVIPKMGITHINFVPSLFNVWVEGFNTQSLNRSSTLRYIFLAGEALSPRWLSKFKEWDSQVILVNIYGPTEAAVYATCYPLVEWQGSEPILIGKPLQNVKVYIFNHDGHLQPPGIVGELCIAGVGLARGYLNNPELTAEKFDHDLWDFHDEKIKSFLGGPGGRFFKKAPLAAGGKLYKTGDLARWLREGNIEFLGRIDHQVKIRGFRIELEEIETQLLDYHGINETVVVVKTNEREDKLLCAYVVSNFDIAAEKLRDFLSGRLPDYMIPTYFNRIDRVPLTPSGKIDRKALPEPQFGVDGEYTCPRNGIEEKLVAVWSELLSLKKEEIGIDTNFFRVGGHSLRAIFFASAVNKEFNVKLPLAKIFEIPTIRGLSEYIKTAAQETFISIPPTEKKDYYLLSSAQKRMYILNRLDPDSTVYNMPQVIQFKANPVRKHLEGVFHQLIKRHESLRTSFNMVGGQPVQELHEHVTFSLEYYQCGSRQESETIIRNFVQPFDLSRSPLLRVGLIHLHTLPPGQPFPASPTSPSVQNIWQEDISTDNYILMVDMHHIISDALTFKILAREFAALYEGKRLPSLLLQYRDYSEWWKRPDQQQAIKKQEDYWLKQFEGKIPVLNIPTDYPRPEIQSFEGSTTSFQIDEADSMVLKRVALNNDSTLYMLLLSLFYILLSKLSDQTDIVVGTPIAGRRHPDLEKIMGIFINTLALRNFPGEEMKFNDFLKEVKERTLEAFENQDYQFEDLIEKIHPRQNMNRHPIFNIMFAFQDLEPSLGETARLNMQSTAVELDSGISKFDLTFDGYESGGGIGLSFEYSTRLFKRATICRWADYFQEVLSAVVKNDQIRLKDIKLSGELSEIKPDIQEQMKAFGI